MLLSSRRSSALDLILSDIFHLMIPFLLYRWALIVSGEPLSPYSRYYWINGILLCYLLIDSGLHAIWCTF